MKMIPCNELFDSLSLDAIGMGVDRSSWLLLLLLFMLLFAEIGDAIEKDKLGVDGVVYMYW